MATLIILAGAAGTGKSSAAEILGASTSLVVLGKDALTRRACEALLRAHGQPAGDRESDVYREQVRPVEYAVIESAMWACLDAGHGVLAEAPFIAQLNDPAWLDAIESGAHDRGARMHVVWLTAPPATVRARLEARGSARDAGKLGAWGDHVAGWPAPPARADLILDTGALAPSEVAVRIAALL